MNYWELPPELRREADLFRFKTELRVRFAETDAQGVVYNGAFLTYLDVARGEYDRNLQLWRADAPGQWWDGTHASTEIRYVSSPRFDEVLSLHVRCAWMRERSSGFAYLIFSETTGALVARARTSHVAVDAETRRPIPIPGMIRDRIAAFEGDRMLAGAAAPPRPPPALSERDLPDAVKLYPLRDEARVRFAETDAQGVVYNGSFFTYLEIGRISYLRTLRERFPGDVRDPHDITTADTACRYLAPARFDDWLDIRVRIPWVKRSSFRFDHLIVNRATGRVCATAEATLVVLDPATRRPTPMPDAMRRRIREYDPEARVPLLGELA